MWREERDHAVATLCRVESLEEVSLDQLRFAIVDTECTGLDPKSDRVIEVAVVHLDPGRPPELVLDTLVDPQRSFDSTSYHGLAQWDVAEAPTFEEVAGHVVEATAQRVFAGHNASFDLSMLGPALSRAGCCLDVPPHFCTMEVARKLYGSYALTELCETLGIEHVHQHRASGDALATAELLQRIIKALRDAGITTLAELARSPLRFRFVESVGRRLWPRPSETCKARLVARQGVGRNYGGHRHLRAYLDEVMGVVEDLHVTEEELGRVRQVREDRGLSDAQAHAVHARVFGRYLARCIEDDEVDRNEATRLARLARCMRKLGWAPGDDPPGEQALDG